MLRAMNYKENVQYFYFQRVRNGEEQYIGTLTERRKNSERITRDRQKTS